VCRASWGKFHVCHEGKGGEHEPVPCMCVCVCVCVCVWREREREKERERWGLLFETSSCYIAQGGLKLVSLLSQPLRCWDYRHVAPHLASFVLFRNEMCRAE
jgi:hypothetical protein